MRQEVIWIRHSLPLYDSSSSHGKRGGKVVKGWGERRKECGSFENEIEFPSSLFENSTGKSFFFFIVRVFFFISTGIDGEYGLER